jgi:hypothetical protein
VWVAVAIALTGSGGLQAISENAGPSPGTPSDLSTALLTAVFNKDADLASVEKNISLYLRDLSVLSLNPETESSAQSFFENFLKGFEESVFRHHTLERELLLFPVLTHIAFRESATYGRWLAPLLGVSAPLEIEARRLLLHTVGAPNLRELWLHRLQGLQAIFSRNQDPTLRREVGQSFQRILREVVPRNSLTGEPSFSSGFAVFSDPFFASLSFLTEDFNADSAQWPVEPEREHVLSHLNSSNEELILDIVTLRNASPVLIEYLLNYFSLVAGASPEILWRHRVLRLAGAASVPDSAGEYPLRNPVLGWLKSLESQKLTAGQRAILTTALASVYGSDSSGLSRFSEEFERPWISPSGTGPVLTFYGEPRPFLEAPADCPQTLAQRTWDRLRDSGKGAWWWIRRRR